MFSFPTECGPSSDRFNSTTFKGETSETVYLPKVGQSFLSSLRTWYSIVLESVTTIDIRHFTPVYTQQVWVSVVKTRLTLV